MDKRLLNREEVDKLISNSTIHNYSIVMIGVNRLCGDPFSAPNLIDCIKPEYHQHIELHDVCIINVDGDRFIVVKDRCPHLRGY